MCHVPVPYLCISVYTRVRGMEEYLFKKKCKKGYRNCFRNEYKMQPTSSRSDAGQLMGKALKMTRHLHRT